MLNFRKPLMQENPNIFNGAVLDALRPRTSGRAVNAHVIKASKEPLPDYEKMLITVQGGKSQKTERVKETDG